MENANLAGLTDNRSNLAKRFTSSGLQSSRIMRFLSTPVKNSLITAMRVSGRSFGITCNTAFGATFYGYIPEAVTSLIWRFGVYEPETSLFLLDNVKEGDVFLDVGAHFGYFSLLASHLVGLRGTVVSIEAMPTTYALLSKNVSANRRSNVKTHQFAAGEKAGNVQFRDYGIVNSSLNTFVAARGILDGEAAAYQVVDVETKRLDDFFARHELPNPAFVKIDAESSEHLVLEGMSAILEGAQPPILLIEMGGGDESEDLRARRIHQLLEKYGYRLFRYENRRLEPVDLKGSVPYFNGIFVPSHVGIAA